MTARFGATEKSLADVRGSEQSRDRKGAIYCKRTKYVGQAGSLQRVVNPLFDERKHSRGQSTNRA